MNAFITACAKAPIKLYRLVISPWLGPSCRFTPTCSAYALQAIDRHGAFKGLILTTARITRCHPWHRGAHVDPVPERFDWWHLIGYKRGEPEKEISQVKGPSRR